MSLCAGCGSNAAPHVCSRCQQVHYCSRKCQVSHWRAGHKRACGASTSSASTDDEPGSCPKCEQLWGTCRCDEPPNCWLCLESTGRLLRGCACRGTSGFVHARCLAERARCAPEVSDSCPTCMQKFVGELQMAAARARMAGVSRERDGKAHAMSQLADALKDSGDFDGALKLYQKVLKNDTARLGPDHPHVAATKNKCAAFFSMVCVDH